MIAALLHQYCSIHIFRNHATNIGSFLHIIRFKQAAGTESEAIGTQGGHDHCHRDSNVVVPEGRTVARRGSGAVAIDQAGKDHSFQEGALEA
jgi:hypothetical protein